MADHMEIDNDEEGEVWCCDGHEYGSRVRPIPSMADSIPSTANSHFSAGVASFVKIDKLTHLNGDPGS